MCHKERKLRPGLEALRPAGQGGLVLALGCCLQRVYRGMQLHCNKHAVRMYCCQYDARHVPICSIRVLHASSHQWSVLGPKWFRHNSAFLCCSKRRYSGSRPVQMLGCVAQRDECPDLARMQPLSRTYELWRSLRSYRDNLMYQGSSTHTVTHERHIQTRHIQRQLGSASEAYPLKTQGQADKLLITSYLVAKAFAEVVSRDQRDNYNQRRRILHASAADNF